MSATNTKLLVNMFDEPLHHSSSQTNYRSRLSSQTNYSPVVPLTTLQNKSKFSPFNDNLICDKHFETRNSLNK